MKKLAAVVAVLVAAIVAWQFARRKPASELISSIAETPPSAKAPESTPKSPPPEKSVAPTPVVTPPGSAAPSVPQPQVHTVNSIEKMPLGEMLLPNRGFYDPKFALTATYPEGWTVRDGIRWGTNNRENTVFFNPEEGSRAVPSMYYQAYNESTNAPAIEGAEAMLRRQAAAKEASRRGGRPDSDYTNDPDSFVFREIDGKPTLSYFATFTRNGEVQAEYFTRILGSQGYVMFFTSGPVKDVQAAIPKVSQMSGTVRLP